MTVMQEVYCIHEAPYDYYRYTEFALRKFAEDAKLSVMLISPIGGVEPDAVGAERAVGPQNMLSVRGSR